MTRKILSQFLLTSVTITSRLLVSFRGEEVFEKVSNRAYCLSEERHSLALIGCQTRSMKKELAFELSLYALCIVLAGSLWHKPVLLTICYVLISIGVLAKWHSKSDLLFYFITFVLGPIGESVAIYRGAWEYTRPLYLIPSWLPFLWGICALFLKNISETILKSSRKP